VVFSRARLDAALRRALAGEAGAPLARLKGIFRTQEGTTRLEVAGGSLHENATAYRRDSRADAIVRADDESALDTLEAWLDEAVLGASELALDVNRIEFVLPDARVLAVDRERLEGLPEPMLDVSTKFPKRVGTAARIRPLLQALGIPEEGEAVVVAGDGGLRRGCGAAQPRGRTPPGRPGRTLPPPHSRGGVARTRRLREREGHRQGSGPGRLEADPLGHLINPD
jgi:hypothetical protein